MGMTVLEHAMFLRQESRRRALGYSFTECLRLALEAALRQAQETR